MEKVAPSLFGPAIFVRCVYVQLPAVNKREGEERKGTNFRHILPQNLGARLRSRDDSKGPCLTQQQCSTKGALFAAQLKAQKRRLSSCIMAIAISPYVSHATAAERRV